MKLNNRKGNYEVHNGKVRDWPFKSDPYEELMKKGRDGERVNKGRISGDRQDTP